MILLCLLWSLVEVQSQTVPYVTFQGNILPNHSYVDLSQVGDDRSGSDTVQCHTDLYTCCRSSQGLHRGDWFAPGSDTRLPWRNEPGDIYEDRQDMVVHIRHRNNVGGPSGIYRCVIATNSVHDDSDQSVGEIVYVGLYANGQGDITISGGMAFTVDSDLNGASPQFTLTCISTGGPATTVTWTRDSVNVTEGTNTVLDNLVTSQYTHTLTVTGRLEGLYTCTVANNKPSESSAQLNVQAPLPPSVRVYQNLLDSILVSWTPPSGGPAVTGYIIYYQRQDGGHTASEIAGATATSATISGLITGATYSITIVVTSTILLSSETAPVIISIGLFCSASEVYDVKVDCEHLIPQTPMYCSFNQGPLHPCTLPLLLNSDVSPLGKHSVRIVANGSETTVSYTISGVPPLGVYLINESPRISNNSVRGEFLITRPVVGVRCFLVSQHDRIWKDCSSGQVFFPISREGLHELEIYAYNSKRDEVTVKREFVVTSDPNYCSLVLVNRGVVVSEDGTSAVVEVAVYGPATQLICVLDGKIPFTCTSLVELSGLTEGQHTLRVSPISCSGGSKTLDVQFTT